MAFQLQNQKRPFNETSFENSTVAPADFFQYGNLATIEKVENVDEHIVANEKGNFHFSLLFGDAKNLLK